MIFLIVPAYNEAKNLKPLCQNIGQVLDKAGEEYQLIIINDGSTDETSELLSQLSSNPSIQPLHHQTNKGVQGAFLTGLTHSLRQAKPGDHIFIMEADQTSDPAIIPQMLALLRQKHDVVIASRYKGGGSYKSFPLKRLVLSRGANFIFHTLFPISGLKDYTIFYRGYSYDLLRQGFDHYGDDIIKTQSFFCNTELLLNLRPWIRRAAEVPMVYDYGRKEGKSGMKILKNLSTYLTFIGKKILQRSKSIVSKS